MAEMVQVVCPHCDGINRVPQARLADGPKCGHCHAALFTGAPVALDGARLKTHLARSSLPVIIDFWAGWCGPCRSMAPVFERAARELEPGARFVKVDVDANSDSAAEFGVQGIPALFAVLDGQVVSRHAGVADGALLRSWVQQFTPRAETG